MVTLNALPMGLEPRQLPRGHTAPLREPATATQVKPFSEGRWTQSVGKTGRTAKPHGASWGEGGATLGKPLYVTGRH